jgi:hypothetical protein
MDVLIAINCRPGVHPARVVRERADGRRLLDLDGGPLLVEGEDCEVVPEREDSEDEADIATK